jgi:hypothetical protein
LPVAWLGPDGDAHARDHRPAAALLPRRPLVLSLDSGGGGGGACQPRLTLLQHGGRRAWGQQLLLQVWPRPAARELAQAATDDGCLAA